MQGRQAFHLPAGLLQAPQSAGGGTSHTNGDDRGSSALCSGGVRVLYRPALLLSQPPEIVIRGHLTGHVQGAPLVVPAQHSTAALEELTLCKDSKRTGTVRFATPKMNHSSCNITAYEIFSLFQLCVYIPVLVLGIVLNVLALWVFCCKLGKWTETRVYMVNLAVADCLLLFTLPFKTLSQFQHLKVDGWCLVLEGGYFTNRFMSIGIITLIAADRYLAIKYPLRSKALRSPLKAAFVSGFLWIVIICETSLIKSFEDRREDDFCFEKSSVTPSVITLCAIITGFFIPLLILSYCSIQIIAELRRKKNDDCCNEMLTRKAVYIVSANMAVFIICFLPLYLGHLLRFVLDSISSDCSAIQSINNFVHFASILANTNCCLDAICYYFVNKEFKEASSKLAKSKSEGSEEAEIQLPHVTR
ncbi:G-protein coupled receptor 35-like [Anomalospiza imberbis]|uniref:G-protein coupled receptor 35-like n=1 Tax=Anomalospiza imberbis TaxID=187417 RepID=UPI00358E00A9